MKKLISTLLIITMLVTLLASCKPKNQPNTSTSSNEIGSTSKAYEPPPVTEFPRFEEKDWTPVTLLHMQKVENTLTSEGSILKELAALTGIRLNLEFVNMEDIQGSFISRIAAGTIPELSSVDTLANQYGPDGVFLELTDYINNTKYMKKFVDAFAMEYFKSSVDRKIYMFFQHREQHKEPQMAKYYRADILDELGAPVPKTNAEWTSLYAKVKASYPDLAPYSDPGVNYLFHSNTCSPFDLATISYDDYVGYIGSKLSEKKIVYLPATNEFRKMLEYYNDMYKKEYLDNAFFLEMGGEPWYINVASQASIFSANMGVLTRMSWCETQCHENGFANVDYTMTMPPVDEAYGKSVIFDHGDVWQASRGIALSAAKLKDDPAKTQKIVNMIDFLYTDYASDLFRFGVRDVDFTVEANGTMNHKAGNNIEAITKYMNETGNSDIYLVRSHKENAYVEKYGIKLANKDHEDFYFNTAKNIDFVSVPLPIKLGKAEEEAYTSKVNALRSYMRNMAKGFIDGSEPFTAWAQYVEQLKKLGSDDVCAIMQKWIANGEAAKS